MLKNVPPPLHFDPDPDPAFHFDADPIRIQISTLLRILIHFPTMMRNHADPDRHPQHCVKAA
jgi:hypothetical protein